MLAYVKSVICIYQFARRAFASEENVDLIMVGSGGLGGITGYLLGSTSHRVADHCKMPILIIK